MLTCFTCNNWDLSTIWCVPEQELWLLRPSNLLWLERGGTQSDWHILHWHHLYHLGPGDWPDAGSSQCGVRPCQDPTYCPRQGGLWHCLLQSWWRQGHVRICGWVRRVFCCVKRLRVLVRRTFWFWVAVGPISLCFLQQYYKKWDFKVCWIALCWCCWTLAGDDLGDKTDSNDIASVY